MCAKKLRNRHISATVGRSVWHLSWWCTLTIRTIMGS